MIIYTRFIHKYVTHNDYVIKSNIQCELKWFKKLRF